MEKFAQQNIYFKIGKRVHKTFGIVSSFALKILTNSRKYCIIKGIDGNGEKNICISAKEYDTRILHSIVLSAFCSPRSHMNIDFLSFFRSCFPFCH